MCAKLCYRMSSKSLSDQAVDLILLCSNASSRSGCTLTNISLSLQMMICSQVCRRDCVREMRSFYADAIYSNSIPRDDYRELLWLCNVFLGGSFEGMSCFRLLDAMHQARW